MARIGILTALLPEAACLIRRPGLQTLIPLSDERSLFVSGTGAARARQGAECLLANGAESFACAVLVEKELPQAKPVQPDFVGLRVPDRFVFGCGMDARGYWRNLPEIRALRNA